MDNPSSDKFRHWRCERKEAVCCYVSICWIVLLERNLCYWLRAAQSAVCLNLMNILIFLRVNGYLLSYVVLWLTGNPACIWVQVSKSIWTKESNGTKWIHLTSRFNKGIRLNIFYFSRPCSYIINIEKYLAWRNNHVIFFSQSAFKLSWDYQIWCQHDWIKLNLHLVQG